MKTDHPKALHLRLVIANNEEPKQARSPNPHPTPQQMSFPYPEGSSAFTVLVRSMKRDAFTQIVCDVIPRWIFDVRVVPRLDTIAGSRMSAFRLFESVKAYYMDVLGTVDVVSHHSVDINPIVWGNIISDVLRTSDRPGPYLFLFDDERLLDSASKILPGMVREAVGKAASFSNLTQIHS